MEFQIDTLDARHGSAGQTTQELPETIRELFHDLLSPLTAVRLSAESLLTDGVTDASRVQELAALIRDESARLSDLAGRMLSAEPSNRCDAPSCWAPIGVADLCARAVGSVRPLLREHVRLSCRLDPSDLTIRGDRDALYRLLVNLLSNAARHTRRGAIGLSGRHQCRSDGAWLLLAVQDTGEGIDPAVVDHLRHLLEGQGTAVRPTGRCGLGLGICRKIAAAHGGHLSLDSQRNLGTCVTVHLRADLTDPIDDRHAGHLMHITSDTASDGLMAGGGPDGRATATEGRGPEAPRTASRRRSPRAAAVVVVAGSPQSASDIWARHVRRV